MNVFSAPNKCIIISLVHFIVTGNYYNYDITYSNHYWSICMQKNLMWLCVYCFHANRKPFCETKSCFSHCNGLVVWTNNKCNVKFHGKANTAVKVTEAWVLNIASWLHLYEDPETHSFIMTVSIIWFVCHNRCRYFIEIIDWNTVIEKMSIVRWIQSFHHLNIDFSLSPMFVLM